MTRQCGYRSQIIETRSQTDPFRIGSRGKAISRPEEALAASRLDSTIFKAENLDGLPEVKGA
jgi:hypothetical protein